MIRYLMEAANDFGFGLAFRDAPRVVMTRMRGHQPTLDYVRLCGGLILAGAREHRLQ